MHQQHPQVFVVLIGLFALTLCGCSDGTVTVNGTTITLEEDGDSNVTSGARVIVNGKDVTAKVLSGRIGNNGGPTAIGSGVSATETREVGPFNKLSLSTALNSNITVGKNQSVSVSSDDNILPLVVTEVKDEVLHVYLDGSTHNSLPIDVEISVPELNSLHVSGSCKANVTGVHTQSFAIEINGASTCTVSGYTDSLDCNVSGASSLTASDLISTSADVKASGASKVTIFAKEKLQAAASGASKVQYAGKPDDVKPNSSGASTIRPLL